MMIHTFKRQSLRTSHLACLILIFICLGCNSSRDSVPLLVPNHLPKFDILIDNYDFDGYIFLKKVVDPGAMLMIDHKGKIVWFHEADTTLVRPFMSYPDFYITMKTDSLLYKISYQGDTLVALKMGENSFDKPLHHEILVNSENEFVALTNEVFVMNLSSVGGGLTDTIKTHGIIRFDENGTKLFSWNLAQVVDPIDYPNIVNIKNDWGHANSLWIDYDGNYLISWRDFHQLWKIDATTGSVIWKTGLGTELPDSLVFYNQHAVHRDGKGRLVLFDNGDARKRPTSRLLALKTPEEGDFQLDFQVALPDSLFSFKQGNVYEIEDNMYLFNSSMTNYLIITDHVGNINWMAKSDHSFYRVYYLKRDVIK